MDSIFCFVNILILLPLFVEANYCTYRYGIKFCSYGCCGSYYSRYCCSDLSGIIAGAVVGGIIFIAFVVFIVIFCVLKKHKRSTVGTVMARNNRTRNNGPSVIRVPVQQGFVHPPPYTPAVNQQYPNPHFTNQQYASHQYNTGQLPQQPLSTGITQEPAYPPPPPPSYYPPGQTPVDSTQNNQIS